MGLLEKIRSIVAGGEGRRGTPFVSVRATQRWLSSLPGASDYDIHHVLVEGLERYNGDTRGEVLKRIRMLGLLEEAGLPLQARLVDQYLQSHARSEPARQPLWRECHLFWDQLTVAYLPFLNLALRGGEESGKLASMATPIAVKSLRYFSLGMRWEYLRGRRPAESAWRRLHKIYRAAESAGIALDETDIAEGGKTSCAREYVMTLLFDLANPYAFCPTEIKSALGLLDGLMVLPVPEAGLRRGLHTHMVDLTATAGPDRIDERWVPGGRLRYLDFRDVMREFEEHARRDPGSPRAAVAKKLASVIGRAGASRRGPRKPRMGEVRAVFGAERVFRIFSPLPGAAQDAEYLTLRDESGAGLGFVLGEARELQPGCLMAVDRDDGCGNWQLLAARWLREEDGQWLLGTEVLSRHPKRADIEWEAEGVGREAAAALFLPLASASQGATSNLLLPRMAYLAGRELLLRQDDGTRYRLRLGDAVEPHESWLRAEFDVLAREAV